MPRDLDERRDPVDRVSLAELFRPLLPFRACVHSNGKSEKEGILLHIQKLGSDLAKPRRKTEGSANRRSGRYEYLGERHARLERVAGRRAEAAHLAGARFDPTAVKVTSNTVSSTGVQYKIQL